MTKKAWDRYRNTMLWQIMDKAIQDLIKNDDIILETAYPHIIACLCNALITHKIVKIKNITMETNGKKTL